MVEVRLDERAAAASLGGATISCIAARRGAGERVDRRRRFELVDDGPERDRDGASSPPRGLGLLVESVVAVAARLVGVEAGLTPWLGIVLPARQ